MDLGLWAVEASGGYGNVMLFSFGFVLCLFLIYHSIFWKEAKEMKMQCLVASSRLASAYPTAVQ